MPEKRKTNFAGAGAARGSAPNPTPDFVVQRSPEKVLKLEYNEAWGDIQKV